MGLFSKKVKDTLFVVKEDADKKEIYVVALDRSAFIQLQSRSTSTVIGYDREKDAVNEAKGMLKIKSGWTFNKSRKE